MHCPICRYELEVGILSLKAQGFGSTFQAVLSFSGEQLLEHTYFPVIGLFSKGTQRKAVRCPQCTFIGFVADESRSATFVGKHGTVAADSVSDQA